MPYNTEMHRSFKLASNMLKGRVSSICSLLFANTTFKLGPPSSSMHLKYRDLACTTCTAAQFTVTQRATLEYYICLMEKSII